MSDYVFLEQVVVEAPLVVHSPVQLFLSVKLLALVYLYKVQFIGTGTLIVQSTRNSYNCPKYKKFFQVTRCFEWRWWRRLWVTRVLCHFSVFQLIYLLIWMLRLKHYTNMYLPLKKWSLHTRRCLFPASVRSVLARFASHIPRRSLVNFSLFPPYLMSIAGSRKKCFSGNFVRLFEHPITPQNAGI